MQLTAVIATAPAATPAPAAPPTTSDRHDDIGVVKRGLFAKPVDVPFAPSGSTAGSWAAGLAPAKQLTPGNAPAAAVIENFFPAQGPKTVPRTRSSACTRWATTCGRAR